VCDRKCGSRWTMPDQEDLQMPNHSGDYQENAIMDRIKTTAFKSVEYMGLLTIFLTLLRKYIYIII
jgi:hypothetical protein